MYQDGNPGFLLGVNANQTADERPIVSAMREVLRGLRGNRSPDEIAERAAISKASLWRYETDKENRRIPDLDVLARLAEAYGITLAQLIERAELVASQRATATVVTSSSRSATAPRSATSQRTTRA